MRFKRLGLIINPVAGLGSDRNLAVARGVVNTLNPEQVVTGPGDLGANAVANALVISLPDIQGRAATQFLARQIIAAEVDVLTVVGGDGTMSDVAFVLVELGSSIPLLGIGAGSTNVGKLITCRGDAIHRLADVSLRVHTVDALVACCGNHALGLAFNDVVIGTTVLGTLAGKVCDLDATAFLAGKRKKGHPQPIGTDSALVTKQSRGRYIDVARGKAVGTVIAGFAQDSCFFGKAIVGGVCLTSLTGLPAGCLICDQPLVRTELTPDNLATIEPIHSAYVSFDEGDVIRVQGLGPPAVLCSDGNPLKGLTPEDVVSISFRTRAVSVFRLSAGGKP